MDSGLSWLLVGLVTALVVVGSVLGVVTVAGRRSQRRFEDTLAASREELATVQRRLDGLARRVSDTTEQQEFVITTAGLPDVPARAQPDVPARQLSAREFASVALGESLVKVASFGYGVRRALSPENRNRITFEVKREMRRSRKARKRDLKEARRHLRAQAHEDAA